MSTGADSSDLLFTFELGPTSPSLTRDETSLFPGLLSGTPNSPSTFNSGNARVNNDPELQENKAEQTGNEAASNPGTSTSRDPLAEILARIPSPTSAPNLVAPGDLTATPDSDGFVDPETGKFWFTSEDWDKMADEEL